MSDHKLVSPIKFILYILFIALFWEFFVDGKYNTNINLADTRDQQKTSQVFNGVEKYTVKRVIDGDTFVIENKNANNNEIKVRMLGVNTPETVDPRRPVECYGKEASSYLKSLIEGKEIYLQTDASQGDYDKYNRLLAYVINDSGEDINKKMILDGYAYEYTYQNANPYQKQKEYKQSENLAKFGERGLWNKDNCK